MTPEIATAIPQTLLDVTGFFNINKDTVMTTILLVALATE